MKNIKGWNILDPVWDLKEAIQKYPNPNKNDLVFLKCGLKHEFPLYGIVIAGRWVETELLSPDEIGRRQ